MKGNGNFGQFGGGCQEISPYAEWIRDMAYARAFYLIAITVYHKPPC